MSVESFHSVLFYFFILFRLRFFRKKLIPTFFLFFFLNFNIYFKNLQCYVGFRHTIMQIIPIFGQMQFVSTFSNGRQINLKLLPKCLKVIVKKLENQGLPCGPVVKTLPSNAGGMRSIHDWGN